VQAWSTRLQYALGVLARAQNRRLMARRDGARLAFSATSIDWAKAGAKGVDRRGDEVATVNDDQIGYDQLTQDAFRGIVRAALQIAAGPRGLPGKHHFYITFRTKYPGVSIPEHLSQRYPDEMTIVLEHQFWDLEVYQDRFRVVLRFGGEPYPVIVPLMAVTRFFDPSVKFGLHFEQTAAGRAPPPPREDELDLPLPASAAAAPKPEAAGAVVSLDAFRKK
jgi:hypothetical protein